MLIHMLFYSDHMQICLFLKNVYFIVQSSTTDYRWLNILEKSYIN